MAAISGKRATDERVICPRIFADANGETHMEDVDIVLQPKQLFKDNPPLRLTDNFAASGTTSATYPQACTKWIGTIRLSVCLYFG
jgi:hypothetical protein